MAEMETLDTLLGPDPAAADNSGADAGQTGSDAADASPGASAGASSSLEQRIAELEAINTRHAQQLQGSAAEAKQWRDRATELERVTHTLTERLQTTPTTSDPDPIPQAFLDSVTTTLNYEPTVTEVRALWDASKKAIQPQQTTQPQPQQHEQYLTKEDLAAYQTQQTLQTQAVQAVLGQHPELNDDGYLTQVVQEYDVLRNDPTTSVLYPEATDGPQVVSWNGRNFDLRLIDKAATSYKAKAAHVAATRENPTLEGGNGVPPGRKETSPTIPTAWVKDGGIFSDPTVLRVVPGGNIRQKVEWMLSKLTPAQRAEFEAQQRG